MDAYGGLYLGGGNEITATTLNNHGMATWDLNTSQNTVLSGGARINNLDTGTITAAGTTGFANSILAGDDSYVAFSNSGTFIVSGTRDEYANIQIPFLNNGSVEIRQGALVLNTAANAGEVAVDPGAELAVNSYTQVYGSTILEDGIIVARSLDIGAGSLWGSGTIQASVTNASLFGVFPFPSTNRDAGQLAIYGNYTQTATGVLDIGLGGTTAGTQYDQLAISGTATLAGQLNVSLINNFQSADGNSFAFLTARAISGNFTGTTGPTGNPGLILSQATTATNSALTLLVPTVLGIESAINSTPSGGSIALPTTPDAISTAVQAVTSSNSRTTGGVTVTLDMGSGTYSGQTVSPPAGVTLVIDASNQVVTFVGHSPALTVASGDVVVLGGAMFANSTDAPTILVDGGNLRVRGSTIEESTGYDQAAIQINGEVPTSARRPTRAATPST